MDTVNGLIPPGTYVIETCPGHLAKANGEQRHLHRRDRLCMGHYTEQEGLNYREHPGIPVIPLQTVIEDIRSQAAQLTALADRLEGTGS